MRLLTRLLSFLNANKFTVQDLVTIGVLSAATKISTFFVTVIFGGPNPLGLIAQNLIFTTMLVILLYRVRKTGTIILFVCINIIINTLLLGINISLIPSDLLAVFIAERLMVLCGGIDKRWGPVLAVLVYDLLAKIFSLGISLLYFRENPAMLLPLIIIVAIGYIGSIAGLFTGCKSVKELKHAGIIR